MGVQVPLWMFALGLAALAPLFVRAFAQAATRRVEARTRDLVARARQKTAGKT